MRATRAPLRPRLWMLLPALGASYLTQAQTTTVRGTIKNSKGEPVPGAIITVSPGNASTLTDVNGNFTLSLQGAATGRRITVSSIGFRNFSGPLETGRSQDITLLDDIAGLDEVVVTGTSAGTTRRQLGNYISTVKAEDLDKGATGNVLAALQGKTAGAQIIQNSGDPAGGISVRLRGISSVLSSSEPLYIVDGVIVNNATNRVTNTSANYDGQNFIGTIGQNRMVDINPADIERVEVLNGAAAAAIYGSRANAGVIQIFTKRGKSGAPVVSFSTSYLNSALRKQVETNQSPVKFGGSPDVYTQDVIQTPLLSNTTGVTRYNYQDYIFRTASGTDNTVSVSGGTEQTKYYIAGSYFFNQGIIGNTDFQRFSFRTNVEQVITRWATANMGLNYVNSQANEKPDGNSFFSPMNSVTIIGNFHDIWSRDANGQLRAVGERGRANPVSVIEDIKQRQRTNRVIANLGLKLKPFRGFTLDYTMGVDNYAQVGTTYIPPFAYNVSTAFFGGGLTLDPTQNGYTSVGNNTFFQINHDVNATYTFDIARDFGSTTQVGFSQQYERNNYSLVQGRGLAPIIETIAGASTILPGADERSELSISGVFLQQNFRYKNQLFLTGAIRQDGSSVFGENQRSQIYTKASASYVISSADFWANSRIKGFWDLAKVRIAYGQSGNLTGIGAYDRFNTYTGSSFISRSSLTGRARLADVNVRPERQEELEFGIDLAFLGNRLNFTANVYNKKVTDLLIDRQIAPTLGFSSFLTNIGSLENKGFELLLTGVPVQTKDFRWEITGIYNHNRNKALNIGQALTLVSTNAGAPVAIIEGQPIGVFYGTFFATDGSGNQLKNTSGIPVIEQGVQNSVLAYTPGRSSAGLPTGTTLRRVIGDPNPDYTTTLTNEFSYKKLSLRVQIDATKGNEVFNADWRTRQGVGNGKVAEAEQLGQLPRGYVAGVYAVEEWRIDDGSFVKLREVSLSYRLGKIRRFGDVTLMASGRNLISWDNYKSFDPEVNAGGQSTVLRGIDFGAVPIPRTFSFSVSTRF